MDCNNQSLVLDGTGSGPFGNISFAWSTSNGNIISGANEPNPEIDEPGTYTLTITDFTNGCTESTAVNISQNVEEPIILITQPATLTCNLVEISINASGSSSNGNFEYSWSSNPAGGIISGENTLTPIVSMAGVYSLVITNLDNGCTSTGMVEVEADLDAPDAMASVNDALVA